MKTIWAALYFYILLYSLVIFLPVSGERIDMLTKAAAAAAAAAW